MCIRDSTYGDIQSMGEYEHSRYYFELADVERLRQMYQLFEAEALSALEQGLVLPAHDYILKCSHTFNVLDTRGAIGVTERQAFFGRMRDLSRRTAEAYLEQRQMHEYPWLEDDKPAGNSRVVKYSVPHEMEIPVEPQPFLLEIGTEELPVADLKDALAQLRERIPSLLDDLRLEHGEVRILGTPRRLVAAVDSMAPRQPDRTQIFKGPPAERAFDAEGKPTRAAEGFAKSRGLPVEALEIREMDGGRYAAAVVEEKGRPALEVLAEALPDVVSGIRFDKNMRWNSSGVTFSRPVRWLLALYGGTIVPFTHGGLQSGRITRGLRFHEPETISVSNPAEYFTSLLAQGIILDPAERRVVIENQVKAILVESGANPDRMDAGLLDEVTNLVEAPTALRGSFAADYLRLPPEVLVSVMKKHQRYFPMQDAAGQLLPYFITIRNGNGEYGDVVADGNEQVIGARFADADFFIQQDLQHKLPDLLPRLATLTFQKKLGSMRDKTNRVERNVEHLITMLRVNPQEAEIARRAAALCKADLVSHMVVEMTALQGVMGGYYARHSGESDAVAQAIIEHYLPRTSGDELPGSRPGLLVGIADRLDTLAGLFAAGLAPSGTKDPFAQRRAALGLVQALIGWDLDFDLRAGLSAAAEALPIESTPESQAACFDFIIGRLQAWLLEQGARYDVTAAVLGAQAHNPAGVVRAIPALTCWTARPDWNTILPAYARCVRITRDQPERYSVNPGAFVEPAEKELYAQLEKAEGLERRSGSVEDFFNGFLPLIPHINTFFDTVLVMAEDEAIRANRLGLLQRLSALADGVADFSRLEGF